MTAVILSALWKVIAVAIAGLAVFWASARNARIKADLRNANANLRRIQTREEIEDEIQGDPDLVARARNAGMLRPE